LIASGDIFIMQIGEYLFSDIFIDLVFNLA